MCIVDPVSRHFKGYLGRTTNKINNNKLLMFFRFAVIDLLAGITILVIQNRGDVNNSKVAGTRFFSDIAKVANA